MIRNVRQLEKISEDDKSSFGGKATNLAKLLQNKLPVPSGFAVGLGAFDEKRKLKPEPSLRLSINSNQEY